ncbi:MAG: DNA polymerase III subunit alpha [Pseudomonadota bacterium]
MPNPEFVHLHVHSEFSLKDGLLKVKDLVKRVRGDGMPGVAITDVNNLFALVKFYETSLGQGIKPVLGAELLVEEEDAKFAASRIVALAMNTGGYKNLIELVSCGYTTAGSRGVLSEQRIFDHHEGLIILSGGVGGHLWHLSLQQDDASEELKRRVERWRGVFGDRYYLELTRTGRPSEEMVLNQLVAMAQALGVPVVATNDVCFASSDDFEAHETRVCIHEGRALDDPRRERKYSEQQYLKSAAQMYELFADIPSALTNSAEIARRCSAPVELGTYYLPDYPIPEGDSLESFFNKTAYAGLKERLEVRGLRAPDTTQKEYEERLQFELDVINQMGFPGYFLIVMEFIGWAKEHDIPVGPGRGSGAGSLVAYALGITDLDPLEYDLLFERFLNPERVSMPDFDVDFCMEGRDKVIHHVSDLYGADAVSQIITFGTMAAKAVVRDVARVQGKPYGLADKLSKLIPFEVGMTLNKAMEEAAELRDFVQSSEEVSEIMDMAYKLEGIVRNVGKHAGGVVIAPSQLTDFVPLYTEDLGGSLVSQYDKDDVERAGLVKFDFLGLKTLTIIDWTVKSINQSCADQSDSANDAPLDIDQIDLTDRPAYELLRNAETTGVFQLESRGMKELITKLKPDCIDDIIALVALFRPGPLQSGADTDYINRKHKREPVTFAHPSLESVLEGTYGVVLYQEQVMQIAQVLAGFSLGQADLLRRAMGKKKPEEMAKVREQFLAGTSQRGVDDSLSNEIFDLMEKFAGYAFNKSHSATYAVVSFQTAWLKAHYPAEFMAANLSADMQNIDRVVILIDEVRRMGVPLIPPSVNLSEFRFSVQNETIVYGLGAVRGVGEGPVDNIVQARAAGSFKDLTDFCCRVDGKKVNRRVNEALITAGAFDEFAQPGEDLNHTRARLLALLPHAMQSAEQSAQNDAAGIVDMFGEVATTPLVLPDQRDVTPLANKVRLNGEKEALGIYLTGHPIEDYQEELRYICKRSIANLRAEKKQQLVAGMVVSTRIMKSRRGAPMCFLVLDDRSARLEVSLFPECFEKFGSKVNKDELLVLEGEVQTDDFSGGLTLRAESVYTIAEARQKFARGVLIDFSEHALPEDFSQRLKVIINQHRAQETGCNIAVVYSAPTASARITLGKQWRVQASDDLIRCLRDEFGSCVDLEYAAG